MKQLLVILMVLTFAVPAFSGLAAAAGEQDQAGLVDAGNKICPISGDPVSGKFFTVYQGKRYGLCCPACEKAFQADPEKYIAKLQESGTAAPAAEAPMAESMSTGTATDAHGMHE